MANYKSKSLLADSGEDGKKKLNPKIIYDSLASYTKASIKMGAVAMAVVEAVFIWLGICVSNIGNFEKGWDTVVVFGFTSFPLILFAILFLTYYKSMKKIISGEYSLIKDTVERVVADDKTVVRHTGSRTTVSTEHAMYLYRCGRVVISLQATYTNSEGDICYVVVFNDKPNTPVAVYNSKYYELEDIEAE